METCRQHYFRQRVPCRPHLTILFGGEILLLQGAPRKMVDLSGKHCYLIENDLGRAGFLDLIPVKPRETSENDDCRRKKSKYDCHLGMSNCIPISGFDGVPRISHHFDHSDTEMIVSRMCLS